MTEIKMLTKDEILSTLRQAECPQITGLLTDCKGGFCALGVLAQAMGYDPEVMVSTPMSGKIWDDLLEMFCTIGVDMVLVFRMNDGDLKSFKEIADWIEENAE